MTALRTTITTLIVVAAFATALALPTGAPAAPRSTTQVVASVNVTGQGLHPQIHLTIDLNGRTAFARVVRSPACGPECAIADLGATKSPLRVVDLDDDGSPEVVLGLFTGGAHCCFVDQVYSLDPGTMTFTVTEHQFLDAEPQITDLRRNHHFEFLSADARIAEAGFTDYADSGAPVQIFAFGGGRLRDVTASYPSRIMTDAARWLRLFDHHHPNGRGVIAAWAADEDRLGNAMLVSSTLASALKHGWLNAASGLGGPSPDRFVAQLRTLLHKFGYTR